MLVADGGRAHQGGWDVRHVRRNGLAEGCGSHPKVAYGEKKVSKTRSHYSCTTVPVLGIAYSFYHGLLVLICRDASQSGVVLVLGCTDWQRSMLYRELSRMSQVLPSEQPTASSGQTAPDADGQSTATTAETEPELLMPFDVTNEVSAAGRIHLYRSKPCLFVTTRILVVDMLNARIQGQHIAGMVIMNAHRVTDASGEAFAVRLFRMANKRGFIRAFSDQPTGFASGFNKVRWQAHFLQQDGISHADISSRTKRICGHAD